MAARAAKTQFLLVSFERRYSMNTRRFFRKRALDSRLQPSPRPPSTRRCASGTTHPLPFFVSPLTSVAELRSMAKATPGPSTRPASRARAERALALSRAELRLNGDTPAPLEFLQALPARNRHGAGSVSRCLCGCGRGIRAARLDVCEPDPGGAPGLSRAPPIPRPGRSRHPCWPSLLWLRSSFSGP